MSMIDDRDASLQEGPVRLPSAGSGRSGSVKAPGKTNLEIGMNSKMKMTLCYGTAHLFVDMGCAVLLYTLGKDTLSTAQIAEFIFLYDMTAFVLQLPIGMLLDVEKLKGSRHIYAAAGCGIIAAGNLFAWYFPFFGASLWAAILLAVFVGIGNALFHVSAGFDVLWISGKEATLPGIFVATGALGLFLGVKSGDIANVKLLIMAAVLAAMMYLIRQFCDRLSGEVLVRAARERGESLAARRQGRTGRAPAGPAPGAMKSLAAAAVLLTLVIVFRSYLGFIMKYTWRSTFLMGLAATVCVVAGKIAGGIVGDRFGWKQTMAASLVLCAVCGLFSEVSAVCGLVTLLLFNMTMPITMTGLANVMGWCKGTAFGINTTALFAGFVWARLTGDATAAGSLQWVLAAEILVSAVVIWCALLLSERGDKS